MLASSALSHRGRSRTSDPSLPQPSQPCGRRALPLDLAQAGQGSAGSRPCCSADLARRHCAESPGTPKQQPGPGATRGQRLISACPGSSVALAGRGLLRVQLSRHLLPTTTTTTTAVVAGRSLRRSRTNDGALGRAGTLCPAAVKGRTPGPTAGPSPPALAQGSTAGKHIHTQSRGSAPRALA